MINCLTYQNYAPPGKELDCPLLEIPGEYIVAASYRHDQITRNYTSH